MTTTTFDKTKHRVTIIADRTCSLREKSNHQLSSTILNHQPTIKRPTLSSSRGRLHITHQPLCGWQWTNLSTPWSNLHVSTWPICCTTTISLCLYMYNMHTNNSPPPRRAQTYENFANTHIQPRRTAANRSSIDLIIFFRQKASTGCTMLQILIGSIPFSLMATYSKIMIMARAPRCPVGSIGRPSVITVCFNLCPRRIW